MNEHGEQLVEAGRPHPAHGSGERNDSLDLATAATQPADQVAQSLGSSPQGLTSAEAKQRLRTVGPNALRSHTTRGLVVLLNQLHNPFLVLLLGTALVSAFLGDRTDAVIIFLISALSIGLGFLNEYRSARAVAALHSQLRHMTTVLRDGKRSSLDVTELVPGDVVRIGVGDVVPADLRLLEANELECDEAVLTGESLPANKSVDPVSAPQSPLALPACAFMGTVVRSGNGVGIVVQTGSRTAFGGIASQLGNQLPQTTFQVGLRDFSLMLVRITAVFALTILIVNIALGHGVVESLLFALSISIGLTPQLLPAIVTVSLSTGARRLAEHSVIVKRLVAIEDFGNMEVFLTDKTGTLTQGRISFAEALDTTGALSQDLLRLGLLCNDATVSEGHVVAGNPLDQALWEAPPASAVDLSGVQRLAAKPFDYERRIASVLVQGPDGKRTVIMKGVPEIVLARCRAVPQQAQAVLDGQFAAGSRVVAVATRDAGDQTNLSDADEQGLDLAGFLTFIDPPKSDAADALARLRQLEVEVKLITGDNDRVAAKVCADLGLDVAGTLTGSQLDDLDDAALAAALPNTTIFARVTPEQKSRVIKAYRALGKTVGFMGDGVNDAVALHDADVGISVDSAVDVAKDAADIVLLDKDLGVLANGISEGRCIFANTIKYVLMGTSSSFGNMFSAGGASLFLSFLPMLPTQILLNNLLYDTSEMTIPTDNVDEEQLKRPSHWDLGFIRRFMIFFGPISSVFDFAMFAVLLLVFHAGPTLFHTGWFVESLATQSIAIFVIRTRRVPFFKSRPSTPMILSTLAVVAVGFVLPYTGRLAHLFGFAPLPRGLIGAILLFIVVYLVLLEVGKRLFYRREAQRAAKPPLDPTHQRRIRRRAARWTVLRHPSMSAQSRRRRTKPAQQQAG
ncbi:MAG TPA: magnesium-translocating P-type ATPase [Thermoleophilia bacterium]|nr:magnesium-translocating P-type ATPase [Thermoleophilia bacterium]